MVTKSATVAARIRGLIHEGRLREGDPLPSTRALAADLGVSRGTVVTAYEQLDGEGYLALRQGARARVTATIGFVPAAEPARPTDVRPATERRIDLLPGLPSVSAISERDWRAAWRSAASRPLLDAFPQREGEPELREEIAAQLALSRGFAPQPDRILVTAGTSEAISLVVEALGSVRVAVENPGYRSGRLAIESAGGRAAPVAVDEHGLRLDALRAAHAVSPLGVVMVTPSHQYPLGGVLPVSRRHELIAWAAAESVLLLEDDYDSEFRHRGAPLPALAALDTAGVVVHLGSFSKILDPKLRCGYLVLPAGDTMAARAIRAAREARGAAVAVPVQAMLAQLMATGGLRRHLARMRRDYAHRRGLVIRGLGGLDGVRLGALDGGLHAVVTVPGDEEEIVARLSRRGVAVAPLQHYVVPASGLETHGFVLGYGAVSATALDRALAIIAEELSR